MKQQFAMGTLGCMVSALVLTGCATLPESMPIIVTPPIIACMYKPKANR